MILSKGIIHALIIMFLYLSYRYIDDMFRFWLYMACAGIYIHKLKTTNDNIT